MAHDWFVVRGGEERGPFTAQHLKEMASSGELRSEDKVRREDMPAARPASAVKGLFLETRGAAPVQPPTVQSSPHAPTRKPPPNEPSGARRPPSRKLVIVSVAAGLALLTCCGGLGVLGTIISNKRQMTKGEPGEAVGQSKSDDRADGGKKEVVKGEDRNKYIVEVEASTAVPATTFSDDEYKYDYGKDDYTALPDGAKRETRIRVIKGGAAELAGKSETMDGYVDRAGKFVEHGTYITWQDPAGTKKLREGRMLHGKQHGLTTFYFPGGQKLSDIFFVRDKRHGIARSWYENGQLERENPLVDGLTHGRFREWFNSGEVKTDKTLVRSQDHGLCKQWWPGGVLAFVGCFRDGKRYGKLYSWNEDGSPAESGEWDGDRPLGRCRLSFLGADQRSYFIEADDSEWKGGTTEEFVARMYYFSLKDRPGVQLQFDPRNRIANYYADSEQEFFSRFGRPSQDAADFGNAPAGAPPFVRDRYRVWTYRCRDRSVILHVQPTQNGSLLVTSRP